MTTPTQPDVSDLVTAKTAALWLNNTDMNPLTVSALRTVIALHEALAIMEERAKTAEDQNAHWADEVDARKALKNPHDPELHADTIGKYCTGTKK